MQCYLLFLRLLCSQAQFHWLPSQDRAQQPFVTDDDTCTHESASAMVQ